LQSHRSFDAHAENVAERLDGAARMNGVHVDITKFHCGPGRSSSCYETETRLSVLLEEVGSHCEPRLLKTTLPDRLYAEAHHFHRPNGDVGLQRRARFVKDATLTSHLRIGRAAGPPNSTPMRRHADCGFPDDRL